MPPKQKLRRKATDGILYGVDPDEYIVKRSNSLLKKRGVNIKNINYPRDLENPETEIPPPNKNPPIFSLKGVVSKKPVSPNTQDQRKQRQKRVSANEHMVDNLKWRLARQDSAITRLEGVNKEKNKKRKAATKIQKVYRKYNTKKEQIKRDNLRGTHYEIEYDDDGKPQYIQMSPQYIEETGELLQIPMPAQDKKSRNKEAQLLFEKIDKELARRGGRTRKRRRRRRKGGEPKKTKKKKNKTVQFSECISNKECDAPKVCYKTASGWELPKELLGTCVDLTKFDKEQPSIKVNPGKLVNNPLRQHPEIGIPHGSELLDRWYGGKKIGLWGNRIKKSMKRLKRRRRKTRKRKRKKSRKKRKRRKRRKTRR